MTLRDGNGGAHRSQRARVAEPEPRKSENVQSGGQTFGLALVASLCHGRLGEHQRAARLGLDECVGTLSRGKYFRPRRPGHMLASCITQRGRCSSG